MTETRVMVIAGEPSGDLLAAELVGELRAVLKERGRDAKFFGAGGVEMQRAGVDLAFDMTQHAVVGLIEVLRNYGKFKRLFRTLVDLAVERRPDLIICVDFSGFNRRFGHAVRNAAQGIANWKPRIVQYVSPQVWASREGRAQKMARDFDLLLAIFPFEPAWYAARVPSFKVEFVGHPIFERHKVWREKIAAKSVTAKNPANVLLLPGSRVGELKRHLPVMLQAARAIATAHPVRFELVLPNDALLDYAKAFLAGAPPIETRAGGLAEALLDADVALASTGTVTLECAFFKVPTVAMYKTSWSTYQIGRRIVKVKFLAMPNILADEAVFPEFVQDDANPENMSRAALSLLLEVPKRQQIQARLGVLIGSLEGQGGSRQAAEAVARLTVSDYAS
jgi:lipid-A-disaccharide synthase